VEVRPEPDGGVVDVVVADHGPGPGGTDGGRGRPGNGLGLFLVRRFLDAAGGHAWVAERPGGGSVVVMRLKLAGPAAGLGDAVNT
ncbi:MAG TPA: ATP-binding protein, partial [Actinomycetes bacterium]|nr:ATP-binding protein [Actinomycetes bacterium]